MSIIASLGGNSSGNALLQLSDSLGGNSPLVIALNQLISGATYSGAMQEWYPQYVIGVATPTGVTATAQASGGTLGVNTWYFKVTGVNGSGETLGSTEVSATTASGSTNSILLAWTQMLGATGYKVYVGTSAGSESAYFTVSNGSTTTFTYTGAAGSAGTVPVSNTTGTAYTPTLTQTPLNILAIANKSTVNNVTVNWTSNGTAVDVCVLGPNSLLLHFGTQAIGTTTGITAFTLTASAQGTPVAWAGVP